MKIIQVKITDENFNSLLDSALTRYNEVAKVGMLKLEPGELLDFHEVNLRIQELDEFQRSTTAPYQMICELVDFARQRYNEVKEDEAMRIAQDPESQKTYKNETLIKNRCESHARKYKKLWHSTKTLTDRIHRERQDLWSHFEKMKVVSKNLQAEAFASR